MGKNIGDFSGNQNRVRRNDDKTVLGPALIYTKDNLDNLITASSGQQTISRLLDDDVATFWESDNKSDNEPTIIIDFEQDVIINYVNLWPVILGWFLIKAFLSADRRFNQLIGLEKKLNELQLVNSTKQMRNQKMHTQKYA